MKSKFFYVAVTLMFILIMAPYAYCKDAEEPEAAQKEFSSAELKKMSTFLSNFTELGFMDFEAKAITNPDDPADMIRFGIWHNYRNNYDSRIIPCNLKNCEHGSLMIDGKYVTESIKKYFGFEYNKLVSVMESDPPYYYDGKYYHFEGADGEATYFASVKEAVADASGQVVMRGELYNAEDETEILGTFEAVAKPHVFVGKNVWAIISLKTVHND